MKSKHWTRAKKILPEVRELPPEERAAFLDEACDDDLELRREIESFLATDPEALAFIDQPPIRLLGEDETPIQEDSHVGAYRILRRLGSGGMGIVYLATRVGDEFTREVAIKVLQAGQASEEAEQRFLQEMGILAKLNHPNIAKLHEGGRTEDGGRLYYLMEYVEGKRIDVYCREKKLALEDRLRLFQKVCDAVQYAHTQLIIHRDIKPSNVLVTAEGEPKLLDFGVAKPLAGAGVGIGTTLLTGGDQKLYTPDYASPEQIAGQDIHTASDVYSLGILLYELLAGDHPFRLKKLAEKEIQRIVCDETCPPPSTAMAQMSGSGASEDSPSADPTAASFRRKLQGDLDTIVLMALRKAPAERYATVEKLADDIEAHLAGHPIDAREPSFQYRARKFLKRNRVGLGIAVLFLALIGVAALALVNQYRETVRERDRAEQATEYLVDLFKTADPKEMKASELSALDLLGKGGNALMSNEGMEPQVRADLLRSIGSVYGELELPESALPLHQKALEIVETLHGGRSLEFGEQLNAVAVNFHYLGRTEESEESYREALKIFDRTLGPGPDERIANLKNNLAALLLSRGKLEEAERLFREALSIRSELFDDDHHDVLEAKGNLAASLNMQSHFSEAEGLFREVLEARLRILGPIHRSTGTSFHNLGWNLSKQGRLEEALPYQEKALQAAREVYDTPHPAVGRRLGNLCATLEKLRRFDDSKAVCRESVKIFLTVSGENHPATATALHNLARTLFSAEEYPEALETCNRGLASRRASLPPEHPHIVHSLNLIGEIFEAQGRVDEAEEILRDALAQQRHIAAGRDDADTVASLEKLGFLLARTGREDEAAPYLNEALELAARVFGGESERVQKLQIRIDSFRKQK